VIRMRVISHPLVIRTRSREIIGCALVGSLGILLLDAVIVGSGVGYDLDNKPNLLRSVAVHSLWARFIADTWFRPLEYLILLAANHIYLPLWLGASLLCVVGSTILSALTCERLFERQLPKAGWWVLGIANPLLFYLVSTPGTVSQGLCNLLFAGAMLAFISELHRLSNQPRSGWCADRMAVFLNLMAAALFFTKETAVAAAVVLPAATALIRLKTRRLSRIYLLSLLFPIGAASGWVLIKLQLPLSRYLNAGEHYRLKLKPITWAENFITMLAFPVTPLPSSFMTFHLLRPFWVVVALASVTLFMWLLLRETLRQPKIEIVLPLLVVVASCAPMILIHSSELYTSMIAPLAVSIVFLFSTSKRLWPTLAYGLLLYTASLGNSIVYCLSADINLLGLQRLPYSIYTEEEYQRDPTCVIGTTAHLAWDGTAITCVQ
jgi:hypothetical protein